MDNIRSKTAKYRLRELVGALILAELDSDRDQVVDWAMNYPATFGSASHGSISPTAVACEL